MLKTKRLKIFLIVLLLEYPDWLLVLISFNRK